MRDQRTMLACVLATFIVAMAAPSASAQQTAGLNHGLPNRIPVPAGGGVRFAPLGVDVNAEPRTELGIPYSVERAMLMDAVTPDASLRGLPFAPEPATIRVTPPSMLRLSPPLQLRVHPSQEPLELRLPTTSPFPLIEE